MSLSSCRVRHRCQDWNYFTPRSGLQPQRSLGCVVSKECFIQMAKVVIFVQRWRPNGIVAPEFPDFFWPNMYDQVWGHTPEQRVAASTSRRYSFVLYLAIAQADARPVMPISFS